MLASQLDQLRERARAATLDAAVAQTKARLRLQVQAASLERPLDPDIADLTDHFHIDETLARSLDSVMQSRQKTFEADFMAVWEALDKAKDPAECLQKVIKDLADGSFVVKSTRHQEMVKLCADYKLDHMATRNLIEAMSIREREPGSNIRRDLEQIEVHLAHSNAPSKLISMKLKEIRGGCNIGAVWHCCGDSKKKPRERAKEPPLDGGIGIEGVRGHGSRNGTYKSYTDHELEQRDRELDRKSGSSGSSSGVMMTEEQALRFQHSMRREERSRSDSRRSHARHRQERRSRSRREERQQRSRSRGGQARGRSRSRGRRGHHRRG